MNDPDETKDMIFKLSLMPCSVIIIGIGKADFEPMKEID